MKSWINPIPSTSYCADLLELLKSRYRPPPDSLVDAAEVTALLLGIGRLPSDNYERYQLDELARVSDFNDARYENDTSGFPSIPEIWEEVIEFFRGKMGK